MPIYRKKSANPVDHPTVKSTCMSKDICQESLTKSKTWVENTNNILSFLKMAKLDKSALAGALMLGGAMAGEPALADDQRPSMQLANSTIAQVDCVAFAREQRDLARENGVEMSRRDQKLLLLDCRNGNIHARIAEQQRIIAELDASIAHLNLRIDEQARILDANGQAIAQIVAINNELVIRAQKSEDWIASLDADTEAKLAEAERILQRLATS